MNPLYVVNKNGVDVEQAKNYFDLILKKMGLDFVSKMFNELMTIILSEVKSYAIFLEVKKFLDQFLEKFVEMLFQLQQLTAKKI